MTSISVRSLLDGSDTISIDTAMVSSQEFGCLLDMVYTGKLPLGKHNVGRIVAAADSLQMFDVAVGFKNVLASLVNQQPPASVLSTQTASLTVINKAQSLDPEGSASPSQDDPTSEMELKAELKEGRKEVRQADSEDAEDPACKRACVELSESSGQFQLLSILKACFGEFKIYIKLPVTSLLGTIVMQSNTKTLQNTTQQPVNVTTSFPCLHAQSAQSLKKPYPQQVLWRKTTRRQPRCPAGQPPAV